VFSTKGVALHNRYKDDANEASNGEPLPSLIDIVTLPGDFATLMQEFAAVAPNPIETDFASLAQYFQKLSQSEAGGITDPLRTLGVDVIRSIAVTGAYERVNSYLSANCSAESSAA
jgi:hypothetical protein